MKTKKLEHNSIFSFRGFIIIWKVSIVKLKNIFIHPYFVFVASLTLAIFIGLQNYFPTTYDFLYSKVNIGILFFLSYFAAIIILLLDAIGMTHYHFSWYYPPTEENKRKVIEDKIRLEQNVSLKPLTHDNLFQNLFLGCMLVLYFLFWNMWKYLVNRIMKFIKQ